MRIRPVVLFLSLLVPSSCSQSQDLVTKAPPTEATTLPTPTEVTSVPSPTTPSAPTSSPPTSTPGPTPTPDIPEVATFDQTFTYDDGLRLSIADVRAGVLSDTGCCGRTGAPLAIFRFRLKNGTNRVFDPTLFTATVSYGRSGRNAEQAFDSAQDIGEGFAQKLLPGRTAVADYAYLVPRSGMSDVVVQVEPDLDHDEVFYQDSIT
jgi:hypothetical protein